MSRTTVGDRVITLRVAPTLNNRDAPAMGDHLACVPATQSEKGCGYRGIVSRGTEVDSFIVLVWWGRGAMGEVYASADPISRPKDRHQASAFPGRIRHRRTRAGPD